MYIFEFWFSNWFFFGSFLFNFWFSVCRFFVFFKKLDSDGEDSDSEIEDDGYDADLYGDEEDRRSILMFKI